MVELILIEIVAVPAARSRGRHHPRVVKRKMSGYRTKARAAPAPGRVFRYAEHIRVVAPAGSPADQASATDRASQEQAEEASTEEGLSADWPSVLVGARPRLAGQRLGACYLLRAPRSEPACLPSVGRTLAADLPQERLAAVIQLKSTVLVLGSTDRLPAE